MVCIFCDIHINNNFLSSFVFSLQYLCQKKPQNKSTYNWISESVQDLILCRCICGYCNVLCTRNLNLIELFHRPHRVPQTFFPQLLNKSTFDGCCMWWCYCTQEICILLHHLRAPKTQSNTGDLVFEKIP
ncbi:hypothetical protein NP493_961g01002 [Ridgeia piscesae]|uniref:Uncharacterized protein n=1 Tax=Ridgeia piscesae TaxID=27915 RepID=A0AAD9KLB4_RIDPI|nr:hypothetical protein NP493_961g01002 [Ridgeia piscesae]